MSEQFHQRSFNQRFGAMGDEAEGKFEEVHPAGFVRYGLNRPPLKMSSLAAKVRYTPDYLTSGRLVECQGVGRDRKLKLKVEKALALQQWHQDMPLQLFVWDSKKKEYAYLEWDALWRDLPRFPMKQFHDGPFYWEIDVDDYVWSPSEA